MLHSSKRWWLRKKAGCGLALVALKRTSHEVWQMECQASNVRAYSQSFSLLINCIVHHALLKFRIQPMSQQDASTTRPYSELVRDTREKMKKMKKLCNFYKEVGRHFSGVVGKEVAVCFLLR